MQVQQGNREKKIAKLGVKLLRLKLGKRGTPQAIHEYLMECGPSIKSLVDIINKTGLNIETVYQRKKIIEYGELGLWVVLNHPDLKDLGIMIINSLSKYTINKNDIPESNLSKFEIALINKVLLFTSSEIEKGMYLFIHADMLSCGNDIVRVIYDNVLKCIDNRQLNNDMLRSLIVLIECGLWTMQGDTAYRDAFFWSVNQICNDELKLIFKNSAQNLVKQPSKWYPNVWIEGKRQTIEGRKNGTLAPDEFSEIEKLCVPYIQQKLLNKKR